MTSKPKDPLLAAAKVLLIIGKIVTIFGMVALAIALGAMLTVAVAEFAGMVTLPGTESTPAFPVSRSWSVSGCAFSGVRVKLAMIVPAPAFSATWEML